MPQALLGGTEAHWRTWGEAAVGAARAAVFVHCSLASSASWNGVALRLADALAIAAMDLPGHGKSGPPDPARDICDQTVAMLRDLVGPRTVDLVGHSFGAVAGLRFALEQPRNVRSLVLYEPVLFAASEAAMREDAPMIGAVGAALDSGDAEGAARAFLDRWGGREGWDDLTPERQATVLARIGIVRAAEPTLYRDRSRLLAPGRLEALDIPVLILRGGESPRATAAIADALVARLPHAICLTIPGAGHMGPVSHPEAVARAIHRHLGL